MNTKVNAKKKLKKIFKQILIISLCIMIFTSTMLIQQQEVEAFVPFIALTPEAISLISSVMVSAGATALTVEGLRYMAQDFYNNQLPAIKDLIVSITDSIQNNIATIPDDLWNAARDYAVNHYNIGTNTVITNYHTVTLDDGVQYPFTYYTTMAQKESAIVYPLDSIKWQGNTYTVYKVSEYSGSWAKYGIKVNGVADSSFSQVLVKDESATADTPVALWLNGDSLGISIMFRYIDTYGDLDYNDWGYLDNIDRYNCPELASAYSNPTYTYEVTGQDVIAPEWDIKTAEGNRTVAVPATLDDLVGKTYADVANPTPSIDEPLSESWWTNALNNVISAIVGALTALASICADILNWILQFWNNFITYLGQLLQPLTDALGNILTDIGVRTLSLIDAISGVREGVTEADLTDNFRNYNIPDLFVLILKVILACIRLVLRSAIYLASVFGIAADGILLNDSAKEGLNFFKNQIIPVLNISIWNLFSSMITTLFGFAVIRRIRSMYSV